MSMSMRTRHIFKVREIMKDSSPAIKIFRPHRATTCIFFVYNKINTMKHKHKKYHCTAKAHILQQ